MGRAVHDDPQLARAGAQRRDRRSDRRRDRRLAPRSSRRAVLPRRLLRRRGNGDARGGRASRRRTHRSARARGARDLAGLSARRGSAAARSRVRRELCKRARSASRLGHAHVRHDRPQEHRERRLDRFRARRTSVARVSLVGQPTRRWPCRQSPCVFESARWQAAKLLPALDPSVDAVALRARWAEICKEF